MIRWTHVLTWCFSNVRVVRPNRLKFYRVSTTDLCLELVRFRNKKSLQPVSTVFASIKKCEASLEFNSRRLIATKSLANLLHLKNHPTKSTFWARTSICHNCKKVFIPRSGLNVDEMRAVGQRNQSRPTSSVASFRLKFRATRKQPVNCTKWWFLISLIYHVVSALCLVLLPG